MPETNGSYSETVLSAYDEGLVRAAAERAVERLGGAASCVFVFVSPDWRGHVDDLCEVLQVYARSPVVVGCSAWGLVGTGREDENASGFSLLALRLPNTVVGVTPVSQGDVEAAGGAGYWNDHFREGAGVAAGRILLGDPSSVDVETLLRGMNSAFPGEPLFGGLASGAADGEMFVFEAGRGVGGGALVLSFAGGVRMGGLVSQGCRPVGEAYTVTRASANVLYGIGSRGAYELLEETFAALDEEEQAAARQNMLIGLAVDEYSDARGTGDYLVRNIFGGDPDAGALAVGALPRVGQTMQFQVRDRDAADVELRKLCRAEIEAEGEPFGGLLFSCAGRGQGLFGVPNHDAGVVEEVFGKVPVSGLFCNGEIGPVGGTTFLHGYTASLALFYHA